MVDHFSLRVLSFFYGVVTIVTGALLAAFMSPEFGTLITTHFGETAVGTIAYLIWDGVVKHLRNKSVENRFGADETDVYL